MKTLRNKTAGLRMPIAILTALVFGCALLGSFASRAARSTQVGVNAANGHLTYSSARSGPYNLFTRNADGSNEVSFLGGSPFFFLTPAYSPDGTRLAFASDRDTFDNFELYVVDIDPVLGTAKLNTIQRLTTSNQANVFPTWSPDGTRIAFMRGTLGSLHAPDMGNTNTQIYIVPATGGAPTLFSNSVSSYVTPAWSPGTSQNVLAFARKSTTSGKYFIETAAVNSDNTMGQVLGFLSSDVNSTTPAWSPDGTKIAFSSDRNDPLGDIWTMSAQPDAQKAFPNQQRFTTGAERDILPAWSPDGTKLVWSRGASGSTDTATLDIWVQNVDAGGAAAGNATNITNSNGEDSQPTWQPAAVSPSPSPSPSPGITLSYEGKSRDRVSQSSNADVGPDGELDGTFTVTLPANGKRILGSIKLEGPNGNTWDTVPGNAIWVAGIADQFDGPLLNNSNGQVTGVQVGNSFELFASDVQPNPSTFVSGATFTLTVTFSDNSTATGSLTLPTVDLKVTVSDSPDPVVADSNLQYSITVTNIGSTTAPNAKANIAIPDETLYVKPLFDDCVRIGTTRNVQCDLGFIAPGGQQSRQITVRPTGKISPVTFDVTVSSDLADANTADNSTREKTNVVPNTPPANDNFLKSVELLGMSGFVDSTNVGATREVPINYGGGRREAYELNHANVNGGKSVWYFWKPPANSKGTMLLDTQGSNFDTLLAVYAIPADLTDLSIQKELASNNDISQLNPSAAGTYSGLYFQYDSKHVYYFVVDGNQGATGNLTLTWRALQAQNSTPVVQRIGPGIFPSLTCTTGSTASDICDRFVDPSGYFVLTIKGQNFTADSQVLIKGIPVTSMKGFDRTGKPVTGQQSLTGTTEIQARIPPNPPLNEVAMASIRVVTRHPSSGSAGLLGAMSPEGSVLTGLTDGVYDTAFGSRGLQTFEAKKVEILPGKTQSICLGAIDKPGSETCLEITNKGSSPTQLSPTYFAHAASCLREATDAAKAQCLLGGLVDQYGVSLNPSGPVDINVTIKKRLDLTPAVLDGIKTAGGKVGFAFEGGKIVAGIISNDGASIVATGGGNLVTDNGSGLITNDGGSLVANLLNSLITNDGGSLITNDGGSLITNDGGSIIGNDGASFKVASGLITNDGGSIAPLLKDLVYGKGLSSQATVDRPRATASSDPSAGVSGLVLAKSSGGQEATFTTETDPVTGEVKGYVSITLDNTSFPRVSDLNGMVLTAVVNPAVVQFAADNITANKGDGQATATLTRTGDTSNAVTVNYRTYDGSANERSDYSPTFGSVTFAPGEISKQVAVPLINHGYGTADFGAQRKFSIAIVDVSGGAMQAPNFTTVTINNPAVNNATVNPLDNSDARFFVRQHYLDFLGREPDQAGWDFWANQLTSCGADQQCLEVRRVNASASYFLSIEFQQTGYLVERTYKSAFGNLPNAPVPLKFNEFLPDTHTLAQGVVVLQTGWESVLENNKKSFMDQFVQRSRFITAFPLSMTAAQFVDQLNTNVGSALSQAERDQLVNDLDSGARTRAQVLRAVAENQKFQNAESNRAFVLMEYFGYLRRDPNSGPDTDFAGYNFWLNKLNSFNGDFVKAEMVKAFVTSLEYRQRFAPLN